MNSARIDKLLSILAETPNDPFVLYALALEYKSTNPKEALRFFNKLLEDHPDYLPAYYQAALFNEASGQKEAALHLYKKGIELAKNQNDQGTLRELSAAYNLLAEA